MSWRLTSGHITFSLALILFILAGFDKVCIFYAAYQRAAALLDRDSRIRQNCRDPRYFAELGSQGDAICRTVEENARIGAVWHAVDATIASVSLCGPIPWKALALSGAACMAVAYLGPPLLRTLWIGRYAPAVGWDGVDEAAAGLFRRAPFILPTAAEAAAAHSKTL